MERIEGLQQEFEKFTTAEAINNHIDDAEAHIEHLAKIDASNLEPGNVTEWRTKLGVNYIATVDSAPEANDGNVYNKTQISVFLNQQNSTIQGLESLITTSQITLATSTNITTDTKDGALGQHGKYCRIDNGVNNITLTCESSSNAMFMSSYIKLGAGSVTFVAGAGTTLVQLDYTTVMNGAAGSMAILTRNGNTFYLRIYNA